MNRFAQNRIRLHLPAFRLLVQSGFLLLSLDAGWRFYLFYRWALGRTATPVARPPAVEGFLPLSALVGLKRLFLTGVYDPIHPAGLTILLAALAIALFFRKGFCGWLCPVGFVSQLAARLGRRLRLQYRPPAGLDYPLLGLKYLLLAFFLYLILLRMGLANLTAFSRSNFNLTADARMLRFFLAPTATTVLVICGLALASLFLRNCWCRYLCPYGALLGLVARPGPLRLRRDRESCLACRKCEGVCPGAIRVADRRTLTSPECLGCLECLAACPVDNCLQLTFYGRKKISPLLLPLGMVGLFILCYAAARLTGHWHSALPPGLFRDEYRRLARLPFP